MQIVKKTCVSMLYWILVMALIAHKSVNADDSQSKAFIEPPKIQKEKIAQALSAFAQQNRFPQKVLIQADEDNQLVAGLEYTFDPYLHEKMSDLYLKYKPDYACFVAMDIDTGEMINISSFIKSDDSYKNLVLRNEYPAASIFKIISAAAAIDMGKVSMNTKIAYNGKSTTLYKRQVLHHKNNKWTRKNSLKHSFAKSVNPVFARLGIEYVGAVNMLNYAHAFGFNQQLETDFVLPESRIFLEDEDWSMAEVASGFTKNTKITPIHAAQIAAIVANDGRLVMPYMVKSASDQDGHLLYQASIKKGEHQVIKKSTANQLKKMMQATVKSGTARKSFHDIHKYKVYRDMQIGGKTGSLTGYSPRGKHDWFVGYAEKEGRRIAFASLIINVDKWYVRSAYVARQFIYHYFSQVESEKAKAALN